MLIQGKLIAYSLVELMVVVALLAVLTVVGVTSYRNYSVSAAIAALMPLAGQAKNDVEIAHTKGTVFGGSVVPQVYVSSSDPNKPLGLRSISRGDYGCVNIDIDFAAFNISSASTWTLMLCPIDNGSSVEWVCGFYTDALLYDNVEYFPKECQAGYPATDSSF